ncbi:MAG: PDZ domain-containing protein [Planctomycetota bacterium]|nr:PDZ domain-containing protein [Planctomycetota bacterium]
MKAQRKILAILAAGVLAAMAGTFPTTVSAFAAEPAGGGGVSSGPDKAEAGKAPAGVAEERIARLEERIRELEAKLEKKEKEEAPARRRSWRGGGDEGGDAGYRAPSLRELRDHMEKLRRQQREWLDRFWGDALDRLGPDFDFDRGWDVPFFDFDGPFVRGEKPRLGIGMAPISEELKKKYGNDVKSGVFVVEVHGKSAAEEAGIREGDCFVLFDGRQISSPEDLARSVREAPAGTVEAKIVRKGQEITVKINLPKRRRPSFWEGMGGMLEDFQGPAGGRFEIQVDSDSLRLSDELAAKMKLTDEQKKRVEEVLAKARKELNEELSKKHAPKGGPGRWEFRFDDDVEDRIKSKEADVEKELSKFLSPEQMEIYRRERTSKRSTSVRRSFILRQGGGPSGWRWDEDEGRWIRPERDGGQSRAEIEKRERF